jgi:hypothetical protein
VVQWNCDDCEFTAWGQTSDAVEQLLARHVVDHHRDTFRDVESGVAWSCPYCASTGYDTQYESVLTGFREHIRGQHMDRYDVLDRDITEEIEGGGVLIDTAPASEEAGTAITYFHDRVTASIVVTSRPGAHIQHLDRHPGAAPAQVSLITTRPVSIDEFELDNLARDTITVDQPDTVSLASLGETISRTLTAYENAGESVCIEMDIFSEMLDAFAETDVFQFVHTLCERAQQSGALVYFFLDTRSRSDRTVEMFRSVFDRELTATTEGLAETSSRDASSFQ